MANGAYNIQKVSNQKLPGDCITRMINLPFTLTASNTSSNPIVLDLTTQYEQGFIDAIQSIWFPVVNWVNAAGTALIVQDQTSGYVVTATPNNLSTGAMLPFACVNPPQLLLYQPSTAAKSFSGNIFLFNVPMPAFAQ